MTSTEETYLGDGLYVSFDGYYIVLRAPRDECDHLVYLEPDVIRSLQEYIRFLNTLTTTGAS